MIDNILIIDTETTGLSPAKGAKMIEVCAILYSVRNKGILQAYSTLLPTATNDAQHINLIAPELTLSVYVAELSIIQKMSSFAQAIVAHNASFDRQFIVSHIPELDAQKWICTMKDFEWPCMLSRKRLQDVCAGMGVDYVDAHRALPDCMFMVNCFNKVDDLAARFNMIA